MHLSYESLHLYCLLMLNKIKIIHCVADITFVV